jgi:hypothetical protein
MSSDTIATGFTVDMEVIGGILHQVVHVGR